MKKISRVMIIVCIVMLLSTTVSSDNNSRYKNPTAYSQGFVDALRMVVCIMGQKEECCNVCNDIRYDNGANLEQCVKICEDYYEDLYDEHNNSIKTKM